MRHITKGQKPNILHQNAQTWTDDLMAYVNRGEEVPRHIQDRYNHKEIKDALKKESYGKCMYCESVIGTVSYPHIEHYYPKSVFPDKTFDWNNLGLCCQICNTNKKDYFDPAYPIVNPYQDNPEDYFVFLGSMVLQKPGEMRGENTATKLKLNRGELLEQRCAAITNISHLIERYITETDPQKKAILKRNIQIEYGCDKPYSRSVQAAVEELTGEKW